jgi:protein phosphatase
MFNIIGDLHSCFYELIELLTKLGYSWVPNKFSMAHPEHRKVVLVGDITDRGWYPALVFQFVENMIKDVNLFMVKGNHDDKLQRFAKGNNVQLLHGLDETVKRMEQAGISNERILSFCEKLPYFLVLDGSKLVVVHAAWKEKYIDADPFNKNVRPHCIFGPTAGQFPNHMPNRIDWAMNREVKTPTIIHGHQPIKEVRCLNGVWNIDTGCVFGGSLSCLNYPEMTLTSVSAKYVYYRREGQWGYGEKTKDN